MARPRFESRISIRDLTDRRSAERERDRLTEQLHQAQRLESLGLLAGGVAHDFNNITIIVLANAQVLLEVPRDADTAEALTEIVTAARRAGELSHQLLAFGRKQVLNPRILRLSDVVNEVVPMLRRLLAATIEVEVHVGLGLSVVQAIASQSGGSIQVESALEEGTTFTVSLPRVPAPERRAFEKKQDAKGESKRLIILLVEDESAVRKLAQRAFEGAGHEVLCANDGLEGQALAKSYQGVIDVLSADIVMPRMGGVELAQTLSPLRPKMHIVLMSGYAADAFGPERTLSQGFRFLPKPFGPRELLAIVDDVQRR